MANDFLKTIHNFDFKFRSLDKSVKPHGLNQLTGEAEQEKIKAKMAEKQN